MLDKRILVFLQTTHTNTYFVNETVQTFIKGEYKFLALELFFEKFYDFTSILDSDNIITMTVTMKMRKRKRTKKMNKMKKTWKVQRKKKGGDDKIVSVLLQGF